MARAKRTARADARRRYRAEHAPLEATDAAPIDQPAAVPGQPTAKASGTANTAIPAQGRVSIATAFRAAFRPLDVRGDLAALPHLVFRTKAVAIPALLVVASTVLVVLTGYQNLASVFMFQYFVQAPAIGAVFLTGFLAPRASWLLGALVGLISTVCFAVLILVFPTSLAAAPPSADQAQVLLVQSVVISLTMGPFFAAAAAWYRRFLQLTNPNRGQRNQGRQRADGRSRTAGAQKAAAQKTPTQKASARR